MFDRLDLAEVLGIWRHARGRVVAAWPGANGSNTVDVEFEGHETLRGYLTEVFRTAH